MYFRLGRLLWLWVWHVEQLHGWGVALSKEKAKQHAKAFILKQDPRGIVSGREATRLDYIH